MNLLDTFKDEAFELLQELESALLALEETPDDSDLVDRVFRALHTLKGSGGLAGCESLAGFCHEAETVFELVRSGKREIDSALVTLTLTAKDHLRQMVTAETGGSAADDEVTAELVAAFQALLPKEAIEQAVNNTIIESSGQGLDTYRVRFRPGTGLFRQGIQPQLLLAELDRLGETVVVAQLDNIPPLSQLNPEDCLIYWDIILTTAEDEDAIRDVFIFVEEDCELTIQNVDNSGLFDHPDDYKRLGEILVERGDLPQEDLERFLKEKKRLGETLIESGMIDDGKVRSALAEQERIQKLRRQRQFSEQTDSIRVKSERLDKLVNLVGEMVTMQARLTQLAASRLDSDLTSVAEEVERLTWDLRDQVLNIRMLPIGGTFAKFKRLVRDLSAELGKDVFMQSEGGETELDKTVIDQLTDPLVHLVRNSIDHGIELPGVRQAVGKPAKGCITLSAKHSGANVLLTVADDGAGMNVERIRAKAIEKGLIALNSDLSERDMLNLIFEPGFSTAREVSNVSGRGVGMDVVRQAIDSLRGSIELQNRPGHGTSFTIKLPLTLAIIDGLLVNIGSEQFVLPLAAVEECIELTAVDAARSHGRNLVNIRDEFIPYVDLRSEFHLNGQRPDIQQVVVANLEGLRIGFVVDHVVGEHQTVIKNLGRMYNAVNGVSGATILGNGQVALILDLLQLAECAERDEKVRLQ